ncbi:MAG: hypothetical protein EOO27_11125 [Comamonadaceae bacterium]|nr:MAG: hypothetical protein EOO27_11125 [Comamonadaceae bacterium]
MNTWPPGTLVFFGKFRWGMSMRGSSGVYDCLPKLRQPDGSPARGIMTASIRRVSAMFWFGRLPLTVRIPLAVTACFLIICVALISLALHGATRQFDRQITDLGQVYLDGLSAALMPAVASGGREEIEAVLNRALDTHVGVIDRTLALVSLQGKVTAMVVRSPDNDPLPDTATLMDGPGNTLMGAGGNSVWTWRALDANDPARGVVVANLDVAGFQQQRNKLALELVMAGLVISLVGAGLALLLTRRIQRPIILLTQRSWTRSVNNGVLSVHPSVLEQMSDGLKARYGHRVTAGLGSIQTEPEGSIVGWNPDQLILELSPGAGATGAQAHRRLRQA